MSNAKQKAKTKNKAKPGVKIILGGKERTMTLDLNAMVAFEDATGKNPFSKEFQSRNMSPRDIRAMAWACLAHADNTLTEEQVGSWVNASNMEETTIKLNEVFEVSASGSEGKKTDPLAKTPPAG